MNQQKKISVVMPVRNEGQYIVRSLQSVLNQDFPPEEMEILIADGMSTDDTIKLIKEIEAQYPKHHIRVLKNEGKIVPFGLNILLREAVGEIIVRVDGHCEIEPDYIQHCVDLITTREVDGVGGPIKTVGEDRLSELIAIAMSSKFGVGGSPFRTENDKEMLADSIAFPAYSRKIIQQVGLYDEELVRNQDDEYNYRIRKAGGKLLLSPRIRSTYYSRASLSKLFKQYYQYGYWKVRVLQKHPMQMRPRQFVPVMFVGSIIFCVFLAMLSPFGKYLLGIILGSYLIANFLASILTASKNQWNYLLALPVVFATLHISYGLGFLVGLFRFIHRWGDKEGKVPEFDFG